MEPKPIVELHKFYSSNSWTVATYSYFEIRQFPVCQAFESLAWCILIGLFSAARLAQAPKPLA